MKLKAVYADGFGSLVDAALEGLGDGLTVVVGPNESGKSTYMALIRQILYGYPTSRQAGAEYKPSGGRQGRLRFHDTAGEWLVARTEGTRGGNVSVQTLAGVQRASDLLNEICGAVTQETYSVVFGFGLDEMASIEHGSDEDVTARLYAGATGGSVNPMQVRKAIDDDGRRLFKRTGNSSIGDVAKKMAENRKRIGELEREAAEYASDMVRLRQLKADLAPMQRRREELESGVRGLERDAQQIKTLEERCAETKERIARLESEARTERAKMESIHVDERMLAVGVELEALLAQEPVIKKLLQDARDARDSAARFREQIAALEVPEGVSDTPGFRERIEQWRGRKSDLDALIRSQQQAADKAQAGLEARESEVSRRDANAARKSKGLGIAGGLAFFVVGLAFLVMGLMLRQMLTAAAGSLMALAGLLLMVLRARNATMTGGDHHQDLARARTEAEQATSELTLSRKRYTDELSAWRSWLAEHSLDLQGDEPSAVIALLDSAKNRAALDQQAVAADSSAGRAEGEVQKWADRLRGLVAEPLGADAVLRAGSDSIVLAARTRAALSMATQARDSRNAAMEGLGVAEASLRQEKENVERFTAEIAGVGAKYGATDHHADHVAMLIDRRSVELDAVRGESDAVLSEIGALDERLETQARDDQLSRSRQELDGLQREAAVLAEDYLVDQMALHLVDTARENFQRSTQPQVVRVATEVFSAMTSGRYESVMVPLGEGDKLTVVSAQGRVRDTKELSRGTAEQLYLALRVGLIESFGAQGPHLPVLMDDVLVNFDQERMLDSMPAFERLAGARQVIFFTCHTATADALMSRVPGAARIDLDRCPV